MSQKPARNKLPDIMIGLVTLALLGGFGFLLFGNKEASTQTTTPAAPPARVASIPKPPATVSEPVSEPVAAPVSSASAEGSQDMTASSGEMNSSSESTPAQTSSVQTNSAPASNAPAQAGSIPPVPEAPKVAPITPPVLPPVTTRPAQQEGATQAKTSTADNDDKTTAIKSSQTNAASKAEKTDKKDDNDDNEKAIITRRVPARAGGAFPTSENRMPLRTDYRISLGSFSTRKTVDTQTAVVRALGYTVHPVPIRDGFVAQVGPFDDEASARRALGDIHRAFPSALLYLPRDSAKKKAETEEKSTSEKKSEQPSEKKTARKAPKAPHYLQVGAFDRPESAKRLVGMLRDAGFAPTVSSPPDGKTTVMVGPYSGDALLRAEDRLDRAGMDYFRIR